MAEPGLRSLRSYSELVTELLQRPEVERSTVSVWSDSPYTGVAEGEVFFTGGFRLRLREELDFADGLAEESATPHSAAFRRPGETGLRPGQRGFAFGSPLENAAASRLPRRRSSSICRSSSSMR